MIRTCSQLIFCAVLAVVIGFVGPLAAMGTASPFCSATAQTFSEEITTMDVVVIARLVAGAPDSTNSVAVEKLWTTQPKKDRYYASPQLLDGLIYTMHQKNWFSAIDAGTGEVVKGEKLALGDKDAYTSVTLAGGLLFAGNESGKMAVIQPGREFKVLAVNTLDKFRSTPVFEGGRMYLRTYQFLYCIGVKNQ